MKMKTMNKQYHILKYRRTEYGKQVRKVYESGKIKERRCNMREYVLRNDDITNTVTTVTKDNYLLEITEDESEGNNC